MYEMLGNQYFVAREYQKAADVFESVIVSEPENRFVLKKLILCYSHMGHVRKALPIFKKLVSEDILFISTTAQTDDDCPCRELIAEVQQSMSDEGQNVDDHLKLGIFWLYCNAAKSLAHLRKAYELGKDNAVEDLIQTIELKLSNNHQ